MENIVINFTANTDDLISTIDLLEKIGSVDKATAEQYKKATAEYNARKKALDEMNASQSKTIATNQATGKSVEQLAATVKGAADSVKSSGLQGAAQQVISGLGTALNKAGVDVNQFNTLLKASGTEAENSSKAKVQSLRQVTQQMKALQAEALAAGGAQTEEGRKLLRAAGELEDKIQDIRNATKKFGSDTGTFEGLIQGINTVAAGYQIAQGAAQLFGKDNEDLQKTFVELQSIMAITNGLQQIQIALQKESAIQTRIIAPLQRAWALAIGESTGAMKLLRGAIAATGIGLLIVAVGSLVSNWKEFSKSITDTFPAFKVVTDFFSNFQAYALGSLAAVVEAFKVADDVIGDLFSGNFSKAAEDAKTFGARTAKAYTSAFDKQIGEDVIKASLKERQLRADIAEAQGKDVAKVRLKIAQDELKLLDETSDEYNQKLVEIEKLKTDIIKKAADDRIKATEKSNTEIAKKQKQSNDDVISELENEYSRLRTFIKSQSLDDASKSIILAGTDLDQLEATKNAYVKFIETLNAESQKLKLAGNNPARLEQVKADIKSLENLVLQSNEKIVDKTNEVNKMIQASDDKANKERIDAEEKTNEILKNDFQEWADYVIAKRQEIADKKKEIAEKEAEVEKQNIKAGTDAALQAAQSLADGIYQIQKNKRDAATDEQLHRLELEYQAESSGRKLTDKQKEKLNKEYQEKVFAVKLDAAKKDKEAAKTQAIINGALGITNAIATAPTIIAGLILAALVAAQTAIQISVINSQPLPKYYKGTQYLERGNNKPGRDTIPIMADEGERIIPTKMNESFRYVTNEKFIEYVKIGKSVSENKSNQFNEYSNFIKNVLNKELVKNYISVSTDSKKDFVSFKEYTSIRNAMQSTTDFKNTSTEKLFEFARIGKSVSESKSFRYYSKDKFNDRAKIDRITDLKQSSISFHNILPKPHSLSEEVKAMMQTMNINGSNPVIDYDKLASKMAKEMQSGTNQLTKVIRNSDVNNTDKLNELSNKLGVETDVRRKTGGG